MCDIAHFRPKNDEFFPLRLFPTQEFVTRRERMKRRSRSSVDKSREVGNRDFAAPVSARCGKTRIAEQEVSGRDFSRAGSAEKM
jgi:hypothetical protein